MISLTIVHIWDRVGWTILFYSPDRFFPYFEKEEEEEADNSTPIYLPNPSIP